jgi:hypothetical protein
MMRAIKVLAIVALALVVLAVATIAAAYFTFCGGHPHGIC